MRKSIFSLAMFFLAMSPIAMNAQNATPATAPATAAPATTGETTMKVGNYEVRYNMKGRLITNTPKVDIMTEEHGTVVVEVTIDKYGHVISAVPGAAGTTTESKYLRTKAKQCAESALYDSKPTSPLKTTGTFTITF
jgi:outer membrane biosynthesis protein TonB